MSKTERTSYYERTYEDESIMIWRARHDTTEDRRQTRQKTDTTEDRHDRRQKTDTTEDRRQKTDAAEDRHDRRQRRQKTDTTEDRRQTRQKTEQTTEQNRRQRQNRRQTTEDRTDDRTDDRRQNRRQNGHDLQPLGVLHRRSQPNTRQSDNRRQTDDRRQKAFHLLCGVCRRNFEIRWAIATLVAFCVLWRDPRPPYFACERVGQCFSPWYTHHHHRCSDLRVFGHWTPTIRWFLSQQFGASCNHQCAASLKITLCVI